MTEVNTMTDKMTTIMKQINEDNIYYLAELFKVFGDSTRIRILISLYEKELSVNEISNKLNISQSAVSHQLKNLKQNRLKIIQLDIGLRCELSMAIKMTLRLL